jgi:hypothetical protein
MDGDGAATVNDFVYFQNIFAAGNLRADVDGSCSSTSTTSSTS